MDLLLSLSNKEERKQKPILLDLIEIPFLSWKLKVQYHVYKVPPLDPLLN
jgi:hypothetical protein